MNRRRHFVLATAAAALAPLMLRAQVSGTWATLSGGTWTDPANWSSNPLYPSGGGEATFGYGTGALPLSLTQPARIDSSIPLDVSTLHYDTPNRFILWTGQTNLTGLLSIDVTANTRYYQLGLPSFASLAAPYYGHEIWTSFTGTGGLVKTGAGTVALGSGSPSTTLVNWSNTFTGGITIQGGVVRVLSDLALGGPSNLITLDGGALQTDNAGTARPIFVAAGGGTLLGNSAGASTTIFSGSISGSGTLNSRAQILVNAPSAFTGTLNMLGKNALLDIQGSGPLATHSLYLNRGVLSVGTQSGAGPLLSTELEIRSVSGTLTSFGANEHFATLTLAGGLTTLPAYYGGINTTIDYLNRENRAVAGIGYPYDPSGTSVGNIASLLVGGGGPVGSTNMSIIPFMGGFGYESQPGAVTYDPAVGFRALKYDEFIPSLPTSGVTTDNVQIQFNQSVTCDNPVTINSLAITGQISGLGTLTVSSGLVIGPQYLESTISSPLQFGTAEGILISNGTLSSPLLSATGPIYGTNGLTIAGGGVKLSGLSSYTGPTTVHGKLILDANVPASGPGPLGSDTSPIALISKDATIAGTTYSGSVTFGRDIIVKSVGPADHVLVPTIGPNIKVTGNVELQQWVTVGSNTEIAGTISGPGGINLAANGLSSRSALTLNGDNSFTGGVEIGNAVVLVGNDHALGTGTVLAGNGSISAASSIRGINGPRTINNPIVIASRTTVTSTDGITLAGPISLNGLFGNYVLGGGGTIASVISGTISDGILATSGRWLITGDNRQFANSIGGTVALGSNTALGRAPQSTSLSGTLQLGGGLSIVPHPLRIFPVGMLENTAGENTWNGQFIIDHDDFVNPPRVRVDAGTLTLAQGVDSPGYGEFDKLGPGLLVVAGIRDAKLALAEGTVKILPSSGTNTFTWLSIAPGASLDLTDNTISFSPGFDPNGTAEELVRDGRAYSSLADAHHRLGYSEIAAEVIKYTYAGDANLDGVVDVADLLATAQHWQTGGNVWTGGDFDYDGDVDIADLKLLASNWNAGATSQAPALGPMLTALGLPQPNLPEPATLSFLTSCLFLTSRRRRDEPNRVAVERPMTH